MDTLIMDNDRIYIGVRVMDAFQALDALNPSVLILTGNACDHSITPRVTCLYLRNASLLSCLQSLTFKHQQHSSQGHSPDTRNRYMLIGPFVCFLQKTKF